MYNHIKLYVNDFTLDLGDAGKKAINTLYKIAKNKHVIPKISNDIFVEQ